MGELQIQASVIADDDAFSLMHGSIGEYAGGRKVVANLTDDEGFRASIVPLIVSEHSAPALSTAVFAYLPSLNGIFVMQLLLENTYAGSIRTLVKRKVIHTSPSTVLPMTLYIITVAITFFVFLLEVRRILGFPFFHEGKRDRCSWVTVLYLVLPVMLLLSLVVFTIRTGPTMSFLIEFDASGASLTGESMDHLSSLGVVDYYILILNLVTLLLFNILFVRYLLLYFPQLSHLTLMVKKVFPPLLTNLVFLFVTLFAVGIGAFALYSDRSYAFRNGVSTMLAMLLFAQGRIQSWYTLYGMHETVFLIGLCFSLVLVTLILNHLPVAIMLSHKKEKDLYENYSFHQFWTNERSKVKDAQDVNPATVGKDFTDRDPWSMKAPRG